MFSRLSGFSLRRLVGRDGRSRREPAMDAPAGAVPAEAAPGARPGLLERPGLGYVQTLETVRAVNRALLVVILFLAASLVALAVALLSSRDWITVYVPPDTTRGAFVRAGTPSPAAVYGFASLTLQHLYHWPVDGQRDYRRAVDAQAPWLTPAFRRQLRQDFDRLSDRAGINELRGRTRALFPVPERLYAPERVVRTGDGVWSVTLEFRLVETIEAAPIKDAVIRYGIRVVRADVDPTGNAWGLMLDGFVREPVRLGT